MAHTITAKLPAIKVGNVDFEFEAKRGNSKLGTLKISQGSLRWTPKGNSANEVELKWAKFAEVLEAEGKKVKTTKKKGS
jgi:hypothetical protein